MNVTLTLSAARKYADRICSELAPFCAPNHICAAGSIRRGSPTVGDIDIVCLPIDYPGLIARIRQSTAQEMCCGEEVFRVILKTGVQLDVYRAKPASGDLFNHTPCTWGTLLLCRTGSKHHNVTLCNRAKNLGYHWDPHNGIFNSAGKCISGETEESVFEAIKLPYRSPEKRQ